MAKFSFNLCGKFLDAILNFQNFYFIFILEMFKKMGRPSRKEKATHILLEIPNGETMIFSIDSHGNAKRLFKESKSCIENNIQNEIKISGHDSYSNLSSGNEFCAQNQSEKIEQSEQSIKEQQKFDSHKFDLFLEKINARVDITDFLRENNIYFNMLSPIIA